MRATGIVLIVFLLCTCVSAYSPYERATGKYDTLVTASILADIEHVLNVLAPQLANSTIHPLPGGVKYSDLKVHDVWFFRDVDADLLRTADTLEKMLSADEKLMANIYAGGTPYISFVLIKQDGHYQRYGVNVANGIYDYLSNRVKRDGNILSNRGINSGTYMYAYTPDGTEILYPMAEDTSGSGRDSPVSADRVRYDFQAIRAYLDILPAPLQGAVQNGPIISTIWDIPAGAAIPNTIRPPVDYVPPPEKKKISDPEIVEIDSQEENKDLFLYLWAGIAGLVLAVLAAVLIRYRNFKKEPLN